MINADELAICNRRGHDMGGGWSISQMWRQCVLCGMWVREVRTIETREDLPPEAELDPIAIVRRDRAPEGGAGKG